MDFSSMPLYPGAERTPERPSCRTIRHRLRQVAPLWAWVVAAAVQLAILYLFWQHATPAQLHVAWGDVYRGWPLIYGLDQGDVFGDECGPLTTYCRLDRLAVDTVCALFFGVPAMRLVLWTGRRIGGRGPA